MLLASRYLKARHFIFCRLRLGNYVILLINNVTNVRLRGANLT